jgi:hypothetical protein
MSVCVCVCGGGGGYAHVSGYMFPHILTYLLQTWREHSMGHGTYHGLFNIVCMQCERVCLRAKRARMCAFAYF